MSIVLLDLNARIGDEVVEDIVSRNSEPGRNENDERMIGLCIGKEVMVGNILFKKDIHKYKWVKPDNGRVVGRTLMDYVVVSRKVILQLLDVRVLRCACPTTSLWNI